MNLLTANEVEGEAPFSDTCTKLYVIENHWLFLENLKGHSELVLGGLFGFFYDSVLLGFWFWGFFFSSSKVNKDGYQQQTVKS